MWIKPMRRSNNIIDNRGEISNVLIGETGYIILYISIKKY